jgi:prepilin-type N-terminal cleavage/methylation domain-containing protein
MEQDVKNPSCDTNQRLNGRPKSQRGMTLLELMIALVVLAVGLGGLTNVLAIAVATDNWNNKDTSATLLSQMVIEQISAQAGNINAADVESTSPITVTDCQGTAWTIDTTPGTLGTGNGATLVTNTSSFYYGDIDQTQAISTIPSGYAMQYVDCGNSSQSLPSTTYDVRWNVMTIGNGGYARLITASARPIASGVRGAQFVLPVNLRLVAGP